MERIGRISNQYPQPPNEPICYRGHLNVGILLKQYVLSVAQFEKLKIPDLFD